MSFAISSSYSSQRAVTASCAAKSRSSCDCGAIGRRRSAAAMAGRATAGSTRAGSPPGQVDVADCGHRKRDSAAAASGRLRRLELGLGVQHLEPPAVATARATLPGATDARHHAHEREDEPPVAADELEDGLHPVMLTVARAPRRWGSAVQTREQRTRARCSAHARGRCRRPHPRHRLGRPGDRALGAPQQVLRGIGPVAELVAERLAPAPRPGAAADSSAASNALSTRLTASR